MKVERIASYPLGRIASVLMSLAVVVAPGCVRSSEPRVSHASGGAESSARPVHWGYEGEDGPERWAALCPAYSTCGEGREQSPIDLRTSSAHKSLSWEKGYKPTSLDIAHHEHVADIIDNGHTIQGSYEEGSWLNVEGKTYELKQFHFHSPSEHTVDGRHFPMEMHLVHQAADSSLAVLGVLFEEGRHNAVFDGLVSNLPDHPGDSHHYENVRVDIDEMLPESHEAYHYSGSLTTPPCSEGVRWLVAVEPVAMSSEQLSAFASRLNHNNRPTQAIHERTVSIIEVGER